MSFFVTSEGSGDGGNLGGLAGADRHCQTLALAVGAGDRTWRAYLSLTHPSLTINARDRIGQGPWYNQEGVLIAHNVEDLHSDNASITNEIALTESGGMINGPGLPNRHDMLTGSRPDGTAWPFVLMDLLNFESHNLTCSNWTSNAEDGRALVGHVDRGGSVGYSPWNAAHPSNGCSQENLAGTGGAGLFYCFATD
jgi:hypothetical protein